MQVISNSLKSPNIHSINSNLGENVLRKKSLNNFTPNTLDVTTNKMKDNWDVNEFELTSNKHQSTAEDSLHLCKVKRKFSGKKGFNPLFVETSNRFECLLECDDAETFELVKNKSVVKSNSSCISWHK